MMTASDEKLRQSQPFTLPHAHSFELSSGSGARYRISIGLPRSYDAAAEARFPVLYVLDADDLFCTFLERSRLRGTVGEIAEIIVVGVGYPVGTDLATYASRRVHDFSTADADPASPSFQYMEQGMAALGKKLDLGGAPMLLDFMVDELRPLINKRYRTDQADTALFGHSAAGNFAGQALFRRPDAFSKFLLASPAFHYNDWDVFRREEEYAESHSDLPVTVYLSAGSDEASQFPSSGIVSGTARMAETLHTRSYPGLRLISELFPGETHLTACTAAIERGLTICWQRAPYGPNAELLERLSQQADVTW